MWQRREEKASREQAQLPNLTTADDVEEFGELFCQYDPDGKGHIHTQYLPRLLVRLPAPLGLFVRDRVRTRAALHALTHVSELPSTDQTSLDEILEAEAIQIGTSDTIDEGIAEASASDMALQDARMALALCIDLRGITERSEEAQQSQAYVGFNEVLSALLRRSFREVCQVESPIEPLSKSTRSGEQTHRELLMDQHTSSHLAPHETPRTIESHSILSHMRERLASQPASWSSAFANALERPLPRTAAGALANAGGRKCDATCKRTCYPNVPAGMVPSRLLPPPFTVSMSTQNLPSRRTPALAQPTSQPAQAASQVASRPVSLRTSQLASQPASQRLPPPQRPASQRLPPQRPASQRPPPPPRPAMQRSAGSTARSTGSTARSGARSTEAIERGTKRPMTSGVVTDGKGPTHVVQL